MKDQLQENIYKQPYKLCSISNINKSQLMNISKAKSSSFRSHKVMKVLFVFDLGKKTVVFDLDETLIHCNENLNSRYDVKLPIVFPTGEVIEAGINIRPYAKEILKNLSKQFEVIIFTASHSCYANVVLDHLDPQN